MRQSQYMIGSAVLAGVMAAASWAVAVPAGFGTYVDEMSRSIVGAPGQEQRGPYFDAIPEGAILVADENGQLKEVIVDEKTEEIQRLEEAQHALN
ncbi:hypothetical protein [Albibacillus kandeliae]|uniref:hypothetical protein n=1 Tax=Albibacillus kandeliae TaxID=2174228 RepID=UPI001300A93B|nr:hypothetical protein [Albibacillus kandeliae]